MTSIGPSNSGWISVGFMKPSLPVDAVPSYVASTHSYTTQRGHRFAAPEVIVMSADLITRMVGARVYDLEQPRFTGMPIHPSHRPGYFYALHRRHRDTYQPEKHGERSSASGTLMMMEHTGT